VWSQHPAVDEEATASLGPSFVENIGNIFSGLNVSFMLFEKIA
jgi:hypothetical protein